MIAVWIGIGMLAGGAIATGWIGYQLSKGFNW